MSKQGMFCCNKRLEGIRSGVSLGELVAEKIVKVTEPKEMFLTIRYCPYCLNIDGVSESKDWELKLYG